MKTIVLGIDLGTTYSAAAFVNETTGRPEAIETVDGKRTLASVVQVEQGKVVAVGELALNRWMVDDQRVVRWIKRAIGDSTYAFQGLSEIDISAEILRSLKASAEAHFQTPVTEAVITCPAYFGSNEIENTLRAGERAGFKVREIVKEPTAAALYFGIDHMQDGEKALVADFGGGTYDSTILHYSNGVFIPLATTGDRKMGGHDWTSDLMEMVMERFLDATGIDLKTDLPACQTLYESCEAAKRQFQSLPEVAIRCQSGGKSEEIRVSRHDFEERAEWRMQHLVSVTEQALTKANLKWDDIQRILLVGGSSRLPRLAAVLQAASGKQPQVSAEPDLSVAYGAAIIAAGKVRPKKAGLAEKSRPALVMPEIRRIIAKSLGTRVLAWDGQEPRITNAMLIPHSTEIPESGLDCVREDFEISADGQAHVDVPVVEFETDDIFDVLANFRFTCSPYAKKGDKVRINFHYDKNSIASVAATDMASGQVLPMNKVEYVEPDLAACRAARKPRWVIFAIDVSGSMEEDNKLANAQAAVLDNARTLLSSNQANRLVGVVSFSDEAQVVCDPTTDMAAIERAVGGMSSESTTAMNLGIKLAVNLVQRAPAEADKDIVLLTDGMPDDGCRAETLEEARIARAKGITLCGLAVGSQNVDKDFLDELTPVSLVIEQGESFSSSMHTLLTQSAAARHLDRSLAEII
jgi:molecular chaperone DnaK